MAIETSPELPTRLGRLLDAATETLKAVRAEEWSDKVAQMLREVCAADAAVVYLKEGPTERLVARAFSGCEPDEVAHRIEDAGLMGGDVDLDGPPRSDITAALRRAGLLPAWGQGLIAVPIRDPENDMGLALLHHRSQDGFGPGAWESARLCGLLAALARSVRTQRDDCRARVIELQARSDRYELIHRVGQSLVEGVSLEEAMQKVVDIVATRLNYSQTAVLLLDPELEELEVISAYGYGDVSGLRIPVSQGATGYAVRHAEPVNIGDVTTDPRYLKGITAGRSELVVPIVRNGGIVGVIDVESPIFGAFDNEDLSLLTVVASYASAAIGAAQCEEELTTEREVRRRTQLEVKLLGDVSRALERMGDPDEVVRTALDLLGEVLDWQHSAVWTVEAATGQLLVRHEHQMNEAGQRGGRRADEGTPGRVIRENKPVLVSSVSRLDADRLQVSEMAVPLRDGGEIIGVLQVEKSASTFTRSDLNLLTAFGEQVSAAMGAARLRQETRRRLAALDDRTRRLDLLHRVTRSLSRRMDLEDLLEEILRLCAEAFDLTHCAVLLLEEDGKTLDMRASLGYDNNAPRKIPVGEGVTGHLVATGVPILVPDVRKDPRYVPGVSGGRSEMAAPLQVFGKIIGALDAESSQERGFDEEDLDLFTSFAAQAAIAIHNAALAERLEKLGNG